MDLRHKLESEMNKNDHHLYIYSIEDLIAVWRYIRFNRFTHSVDFSRVPEEWRFSTAAFEAIRLKSQSPYKGGPITYDELSKSQLSLTHVRQEMSTVSCHHSGGGNAKWPGADLHPRQVAGALEKSGKAIPLILDFNALIRVCKEVGISSRVKYKIIDGHQYVIFTRPPSSPGILLGVAYPTDSRKIIRLAIGRMGVKNFIAGGARLTIYLSVPISVLRATLSDYGLMASMIGHVAMDLVKIGIATLVAYIAGVTLGGIITWTIFPLIAAIGVGSFSFARLNDIDKNYRLTDKLVTTIEKYMENLSGSMKDNTIRGMEGAVRHFYGNANWYDPLSY